MQSYERCNYEDISFETILNSENLQGAQECQPGDGSVCNGRPICEDIKGGLSCTCFEQK